MLLNSVQRGVHTVIRMPHSVFAPYTSITTNILFFDNTGATEETWFYRLDMPEGYKNFLKTKPMKVEHFAPAKKWWNDRKELIQQYQEKRASINADIDRILAEISSILGIDMENDQ